MGGAHDFGGPGLAVLAGDVDTAFGHRSDGGGVDLGAGFGAVRPGNRGACGEMLEEAEGHLGAAGVVDTQEQHDGSTVVALTLDLGQRGQAPTGEPFGEQRQEMRMRLCTANWSKLVCRNGWGDRT